jgi:hypothetical protein
MQYLWRLGATLVAALIFFACAGMVFLRKDPKTAPVGATKVTTLRLVPARATVMSAEAQRLWAEHERWLQQAAAPKARAA